MYNSEAGNIPVPSMTKAQKEKYSWCFNVNRDIGAGIVATFCLLPEVMGFMLSIGIPPFLGLFTCIVLTITLSITGGRPGVITACAGATATVCIGLISKFFIDGSHPEYLFAAVILGGIIQIALGFLKVGNFIKMIPAPIMHGFVNGLAAIILISQIKMLLKEEKGNMAELLITIGVGLLIIFLFNLLKKKVKAKFLQVIPAPIVCVVAISIFAIVAGRPIMRIGDLGSVSFSPKYFFNIFSNFGNVFSAEGMKAIIPVAISIAIVGLIETMLTARLVSEDTKTPELTDLNRECKGQGIGNIACGILGTMPGCAMVAATKANVSSGGMGRLSSLSTGLMMAVLLFVASPVLSSIPLAALIAVMFFACFETFNWDSIFKCKKAGLTNSLAMLLVVLLVLATDNLAIGVAIGLLAFGVFIACQLLLPARITTLISFIIVGVAILIAPFGIGLAFSIVLSAIGLGLASIPRIWGGKILAFCILSMIINSIVLIGSIFMVILNSYILVGHFPWFSL